MVGFKKVIGDFLLIFVCILQLQENKQNGRGKFGYVHKKSQKRNKNNQYKLSSREKSQINSKTIDSFHFWLYSKFITFEFYSDKTLKINLPRLFQQKISQIYNFISYQKHQMNRSSTSPFRNTGVSRPSTTGNIESLQQLIRSLQRENNSLVEEMTMLRNKTKKVGDLQQKIDLVLKHNTQLLSQNQKLAKLINQKKSQVQVWKSKYDTLSVNRSTTNDLQNRRLLNQIQKLKQQITDLEHVKNMQISQLKNQNHAQIQALKRNHLNNNEKYELQIRKLKEYVEKKQYEISDLNMKFVRLNKENEFEIGKLREEKERLRSDLAYEEVEHRKEVEGLKAKFDYNFHSEVENMKKQHLNQIEALDYENTKLKEVINSKNLQIQAILAKNQKIKNNYEDSLSLLKKQNEDLKDKMIESQHINDLQLNNLKDKLDGMRESQLQLLKNSHQNQLDLCNRQINKLNEIIDDRTREMEQFIMERNQMRNDKENQIINCKAELETQINQNKNLVIRYEEKLKNCDYDYRMKEEELDVTRATLESQVKTLKSERDSLNELLEKKTQQLFRTRAQFNSEKQKLSEEVQCLRNQVANLKDDLERETRKGSSDVDDLKQVAELKERQYQTNLKNLQQQIQQNESIIKQLQGNLQTKQDEITQANLKIQLIESSQKELRRELRQNAIRWDAKQKELNSLIKNQTQQAERTRKKQVDQLNGIHENKTNSMRHQLKQKERQVQDKNAQLNELKQKYENLVNKFEQVFRQRAAEKKLDIKIPGWLPETLATKDLFDVFLKTKVLQYCS